MKKILILLLGLILTFSLLYVIIIFLISFTCFLFIGRNIKTIAIPSTSHTTTPPLRKPLVRVIDKKHHFTPQLNDKIQVSEGSFTLEVSFQDQVLLYLDHIASQECQSSITKIHHLIEEGNSPIREGTEFDVIKDNREYLFYVPNNFVNIKNCKLQMMQNLLIWEACNTQRLTEREKASLTRVIKKISLKLAGQDDIITPVRIV